MTLPPPRTIALIAAIVLLAVAAMTIPSCLAKQRNAASQAKVDVGQAGASVDSGVVAINTVENVGTLADETDAAVADGKAAVRAAPEADRSRVTIIKACQMRAYRDTPRCRGIEQ